MELIKNTNGFVISKDGVDFDFETALCPEKDGFVYTLTASGSIPVPKTEKGDRLLLPVDEGVALIAERDYPEGQFSCDTVGGSFCSRAGTLNLVILERAGKCLLIALADGLHASYSATKENGLYRLFMKCTAPTRVIYACFDSVIAACRFYRAHMAHAQRTLAEKLQGNPEIAKLLGGAIFWVWNDRYDEVMYSDKNTDIDPTVGDDLLKIADALHESGVDKALFGIFFNGDAPAVATLYDTYGYLATQYDNYNDVLNPALLSLIPTNRVRNCDYTARRMRDYPDGISIGRDGKMSSAWALRGFDGKFYNQNTLCPSVAAARMREEIPKILEETPDYRGRFIDVYGGSISDCFSKAHPLTRQECLAVKQRAFLWLEQIGLIAGTEDGFEDLFDSIVYAEGLHSPVHFRNADSGRRHAHCYQEKDCAHLRINMLDPACRVPLLEMVYHDCILPYPYWGDSTECAPNDIRRRVLFAALYGAPPLYSFSVGEFPMLKDIILESYRKITAVHAKTALLPMTDYRVLDGEYTLFRSVFGDRYAVTANFSEHDVTLDGKTIPPLDFILEAL